MIQGTGAALQQDGGKGEERGGTERRLGTSMGGVRAAQGSRNSRMDPTTAAGSPKSPHTLMHMFSGRYLRPPTVRSSSCLCMPLRARLRARRGVAVQRIIAMIT